MAIATRTTGERKAGLGLGLGLGLVRSSLAFEEFIELVEDLRGSGDSFFVVAVFQGDAGDHGGYPGGLFAAEGVVLQIDVVDDLAEGVDGLVGDAKAVAEDFEGAAVFVMRKL